MQSVEAAWSASSAVREFSGTHRTIRALIGVFTPVVTGWQQGDDKRTRALAEAVAFAVEGTRFHHSVEDNDYWPAVIRNGADEAALRPLMDEHHDLDPILDQLDAQAKALHNNPDDEHALSSTKTLFGELADHLQAHLDHEEPIFFPLLAEYLPEKEGHRLAVKAGKSAPRKGFSWIMAGATYAMRPREADEFLHSLPKPLMWLRPVLLGRYRKNCRLLGIHPSELGRINAA
jgi:hemerythrin-like domain-containing protein